MDNKQKFAFFGSDILSVTVLETLKNSGFIPDLLISTEDKPKGRGLILSPSIAKTWAIENNIDFITPKNLRDVPSELLEKEFDVFIVASYGIIIPKKILDIPKLGTLNVHPSLLPKYRGPSPIQSAILNRDKKMGVTIMLLDEQMDHGPIIEQEEFDLLGNESFDELIVRSGKIGGQMLANIFSDMKSKISNAQKQDDNLASYTKMFDKKDGLIDLNNPEESYRKFLAFSKWPGIYFFSKNKGKEIRVKITSAKMENGNLIIEKVIPEGKKETSWGSFKSSLKS